ncbi:MAG: YhcH/YjgK/YiaL family protein [Candidatus Omnitrophica bacterium]|nr:YhcH/YjgK/YiaL family protein [Candidatus Omnitrophota bacterium]
MIFDSLDRLNLYESIPRSKEIVEFLNANDFLNLELGDRKIIGDDLIAKVMEYETKPHEELFFETHDHHIDVQVMLSGGEVMQVINTEHLIPAQGPDIQGDFHFYKPNGPFSSIYVAKRFFTVFFPWDAHRPGCSLDQNKTVKKVVFKIKIV